MDILSIIGILMGIAAVVGGNFLEGGHIGVLVNGPAIIIVFGGTIGAVMLQTPHHTFLRALKIVKQVLSPLQLPTDTVVKKMVMWSNVARRDGLLGLEEIAESEPDRFARKGLQLLVDGSEPEVIRNVMEIELDVREDKDIQAANVFEGMGGYSPTIGIIGAVLGLIHVMQNLADPTRLGDGIASAFVATIYGVGLANLLFLPIAAKLKTQVRSHSQLRELIIDGIVSIAEGENPRNIETRLNGYLTYGSD